MSKCDWWGYVKCIIREYPNLKKQVETPLFPTVTAQIGTGGGFSKYYSGTSSVEKCVIHDLPECKQRRFEAVDRAIHQTKKAYKADEAKNRLMVIDLVYFKKSHSLAGAALAIGHHENTCGKYSADFIRLVADNLDLV